MIWAILALSATLIHIAAQSADVGTSGVVLRPASNVFRMLALPGWAVGAMLWTDPTRSIGAAAVAYSVGLSWFPLGVLLWSRVRRTGRAAARHEIDVRRVGGSMISRRRMLIDGCGGAVVLLGAGGIGRASLKTPWSISVKRYTVPIADLPVRASGLRICFVSDFHLGPMIPEGHVSHAVRLAMRLRPDLFVLGGDYVSTGRTAAQTREYIDRAAGLLAPLASVPGSMGVLAVLGNHDWWADAPRIRERMEESGIRFLDNTRVYVNVEQRRITRRAPGAALCVAGLGDLEEDRTDIAGAFHGIDPGMPRLVVAHQPDSAEHPPLLARDRPRIDLMLCGHTHGGQVRLPVLGTPVVPSRYGQKFAGGLVTEHLFPVLVNRGIGMSILPVRFGVPPEVVEVTLVRGDRSAPTRPAT